MEDALEAELFEEDTFLDVDLVTDDVDEDEDFDDEYDVDDFLAYESDVRRGVYDDWPSEFED